MGTIVGVIAAALIGVVLAGVGAFTVVQLGSTSSTSRITAPLVVYGNR